MASIYLLLDPLAPDPTLEPVVTEPVPIVDPARSDWFRPAPQKMAVTMKRAKRTIPNKAPTLNQALGLLAVTCGLLVRPAHW